MNRRVVITGCGAVGPFGGSFESQVEAIRSGRSAVERTDWACAARVHGPLDPGPVRASVWRRLDRSSRMAVSAVRQALLDAGLGATDGPSSGIVFGTMTAGVTSLRDFLSATLEEGPVGASPMLFPFTVPNSPASQCSILLGLDGPNLTVSEMEASGLAAIATAAGLVADGACDLMVAGGVDEWVAEYDRAWARMRLTHRGDPAAFPGPFGRARRGFVPGEGAYAMVLESFDRAARRGVRARAEIAGEAMTHASGPAHAWPSKPEPMAEAIAAATSRARLRPEEIGYVAAGANGSRVLDALEVRAIRAALGGAARRVPVTSVKGAVGESGSASACAVLVAAASIRDGFVPPVAGLDDPDPDLDLNLVVGEARRGPVPSVLVDAFGTGGSCAAVILKRI